MEGKIRDYEQEIDKKKTIGSQQGKSSGGGSGFSPVRASELPIPRSKIPTSSNSTSSPLRKPMTLSQRDDQRYVSFSFL